MRPAAEPSAQPQPGALPPAKRQRTDAAGAAPQATAGAAPMAPRLAAAPQRALRQGFGSSHFPASVALPPLQQPAGALRSGSTSPEYHTDGGRSHWRKPWRQQQHPAAPPALHLQETTAQSDHLQVGTSVPML